MVDILLALLQGIGVTVAVTGLAIVIGLALGAPIAALRLSPNRLLSFLAGTIVNVVRGVPAIVWLFFVFYGLGSSVVRFDAFTTAVLTLGIFAAAQFAEVYRGGLLSVPRGQTEAARVLGFSRFHVFTLVRLPQSLLAAIPSAATVAIGLLKESAVVSIIGVMDITGRASAAALRSSDDILIYCLAAVIYIALSIPVALLARGAHAALEKRVHAR